MKKAKHVPLIPAKAGIQIFLSLALGPRFRGAGLVDSIPPEHALVLRPPAMECVVEQRAYCGFFDRPGIPVRRRHRDARGFVQPGFIEPEIAQRRRRTEFAGEIE